MKINIKGLDSVLKHLNKVSINLEKMANEILSQLIDIGYQDAKVGFDKAIYDGDNDVELSIVWDKLKARLVANGESVLYIEFGSGIHYYDGTDLRGSVKPQVSPIGTRGKQQGATGKHWVYGSSVEPTNPSTSYMGAGETLPYYEKPHTEKNHRTWLRKDGSIGEATYIRHRKGRYRTSVIKQGYHATKGNRPNRAMYQASSSMHREIGRIILEVANNYVRH